MQEHFSNFIPRSESVLLARLSGPEADGGVRSRPAWKGLCAPAGQQVPALRVGHPSALGASEGPGL